MDEWIRSHFEVDENGWENSTNGPSLPAFRFRVGKAVVRSRIEWFVSKFGASAPVSATQLKATDPENQLGWHKHFDSWAAQGILPTE